MTVTADPRLVAGYRPPARETKPCTACGSPDGLHPGPGETQHHWCTSCAQAHHEARSEFLFCHQRGCRERAETEVCGTCGGVGLVAGEPCPAPCDCGRIGIDPDTDEAWCPDHGALCLDCGGWGGFEPRSEENWTRRYVACSCDHGRRSR